LHNNLHDVGKMKTISFINQKGGVGKTTLCANIAHALDDVAPGACHWVFIDADPQGSLRDWHNTGNNDHQAPLICADTRQSLLSAHRIASSTTIQDKDFKYCFIDTPGKLSEITGAALSVSDYVIIPIQPSALDVWATVDSIDLLRSAMCGNPKLKGCFVVNRAIKHCKINTELLSAIAEADPMGEIPVCQTIIHGRVIYARSANEGLTVFDSFDQSAVEEITELTQFIYNELHA
jgi:chromosome partitioning protein